MRHIFIIEHLEPKLWKWCLLDYENISKIVGKGNLWITNLKSEANLKKLGGFAKCFKQSVRELGLKTGECCVLDADASKTLSSADKKFRYFIFGGILGDYPPRKRTKKELSKFLNCSSRNLGKKQFPTDNAVYVVREIIHGKKIEDMEFQNKLIIKKDKISEIILPFRYALVNGKPLVSPKIVSYLKSKKGF